MTSSFVLPRTKKSVDLLHRDPTVTHYSFLGVSPGACTSVELDAARRQIARLFHPDFNEDGTAVMAHANVAYDTLSNARTRKAYDAGLRSLYRPCPSCEGNGFHVKQKGFTGTVKVACPDCGRSGWVRK